MSKHQIDEPKTAIKPLTTIDTMPIQFDNFGVRFLYPDNWKLVPRDDEEGEQGATLEFPGGGFVSIEAVQSERVEELVERVVQAICADYEEVEREDLSLDVVPAGTPVTDLRFYYLDLLIVSRIVILQMADHVSSGARALLLQFQAESRDFDKNEQVFAAVLKQIVDAVEA